jgi:hypothetical protein
MATSAQDLLIAELAELFRPVIDAAGEPDGAQELFEALGWDIGAITGLPSTDVDDAVDAVVTAFAKLEAVQPPFDELDDLIAGLDATAAVTLAVKEIGDLANQAPTPPTGLDELGIDLIEFLVTSYLERRFPRLNAILRVLTVIREPTASELPEPVAAANGRIQRLAVANPRVDFAQVGLLLKDPVVVLKTHYLGTAGLKTAADAAAAGDRIFGALDELLAALGGGGLYRLPPGALPANAWGQAGEVLARASAEMRLPIGRTGSELGVLVSLSPADTANLGLILAPMGHVQVSETFQAWTADLTVDASVAAVAIGPAGVLVVGTGGALDQTAQLSASATLTKNPGPTGTAFLVGSATGSHLMIGQFAVGGHFRTGAGAQDYGVDLAAGDAEVLISPADLDGFLKTFLPPNGIRAPFDLSIGWSHVRGVHVSGSIGIEVELPMHLSLGGILDLDSLFVAARLKTTGALQAQLAASATLRLGPLTAVVERIGLQADVTFPEGGGNLGPAELTPAFKPPSGLGLALRAGPAGGGGYLFFDPDAAQYAGALQLDIKVVRVNAVGLLTTRLPGNVPGFSLLIIIAAEFPPIQLGFGFTLNGVGGLLGVNRTVNRDALRAGLKDGTLDSIRMPRDVVANAAKIISDLRASFPVAPGQFLLGPMVAVGWGTPTIVRLDLGLILELPSPLRLFVLGKLTVALPTETKAVVLLKLDVLGELDFDKRRASMLGTFRDSRVATFPISGDMAAAVTWDERPTFAMSAGGFHPRYTSRPPDIPSLDRLAIALCDGDNPRLRLEAYMAVTSNSVQTGARLELYASKDLGVLGFFEVRGHLGFDVLIMLSPFSLLVEFSAELTLLRNGDAFVAITLDLSLSGPSPWHGWGMAKFKVLGIEKSISVDVTVGEPAPPPAIEPVDAGARLLAALAERTAWTAALPPGAGLLVKLRSQPEGATELLVHSAAQLTVRQRVLPLDMDLDRFGAAPLAGARRFSLGTVHDPVTDPFAPGEYLNLSDDQKLSRPAFEPMRSGCRLQSAATSGGTRTVTAFDYRTIVIDEPDRAVAREWTAKTPMALDAAMRAAAHGPAARCELRGDGQARFTGPDQVVSVSAPAYVIASTETLTAGAAPATYVGAEEARRAADETARGGRAPVQVIGAHEVLA